MRQSCQKITKTSRKQPSNGNNNSIDLQTETLLLFVIFLALFIYL